MRVRTRNFTVFKKMLVSSSKYTLLIRYEIVASFQANRFMFSIMVVPETRSSVLGRVMGFQNLKEQREEGKQ